MNKWFIAVCIALVATGTLSTAASAAPEDKVNMKVMNGQEGAVRPDLDTATVELVFENVQMGSAHLRLSSPERKLFSPTDFPRVEGTILIDSILSIEQGRASFDYMFPIRGNYPVSLEVFDEHGKSLGLYQLSISIQENPKEVQNALVFLVLLGGSGLLAGWGLSKRRLNVSAV